MRKVSYRRNFPVSVVPRTFRSYDYLFALAVVASKIRYDVAARCSSNPIKAEDLVPTADKFGSIREHRRLRGGTFRRDERVLHCRAANPVPPSFLRDLGRLRIESKQRMPFLPRKETVDKARSLDEPRQLRGESFH
ncbi:hypothetical protein KM043_012199 [Ampulex compressa]|nr:hypothetical protein KM043_012199 [Ampulex compressa]